MTTYPGDPGDPPATTSEDPDVGRVLWALRDLLVTRQLTARRVLDAAGGAGLTPAQQAEVLAEYPPESASTGGPADPRWRSEPIPGPGSGGSV